MLCRIRCDWYIKKGVTDPFAPPPSPLITRFHLLLGTPFSPVPSHTGRPVHGPRLGHRLRCRPPQDPAGPIRRPRRREGGSAPATLARGGQEGVGPEAAAEQGLACVTTPAPPRETSLTIALCFLGRGSRDRPGRARFRPRGAPQVLREVNPSPRRIGGLDGL